MEEIIARIASIILICVLFGGLICCCVFMYLGWRDARNFFKKFDEFVEEFKKQK